MLRSGQRLSGSAGPDRVVFALRERATLLGGTLDANQTDCTFRLDATIPYGGHQS
jgi:hypothetical protein